MSTPEFYEPEWFSSEFFTGGLDSTDPSLVLANHFLIELYLRNSGPLTLPADLTGGPLLVSTVDTYAPFLRAAASSFDTLVESLTPSGFWRLSERTGLVAVDAIAGRDGDYIFGPVLNQPTLLGGDPTGSVFLDGVSNSYIGLAFDGDDPTFDIGFGSMSWALCFRAQASAVSATTRALLHKVNADGTGGLHVAMLQTTGQLQVRLHASVVATTPLGYADDQPHLLVVVVDRAQQVLWVYVDGNPTAWASLSTLVGVNLNSTSPLRIGRGTSLASGYWQGWVQRCAVFPTVLTADAVQALHRARVHMVESLFAARVLEEPTIGFATRSQPGEVPQPETVSFRLSDPDGALAAQAFAEELRGKLVRIHRIATAGLNTELDEDFFVGTIASFNVGLHEVAFLVTAVDQARMQDRYPKARVTRERGVVTVAVKAGGNTGTGTLGPVTATAAVASGVWTIRITTAATNGGLFEVRNPQGVVVGIGAVGSVFSGGGLRFTVSDGSVDFVVGDGFDLQVPAGLHQAGDQGAVLPTGIGIGRRIALPNVRYDPDHATFDFGCMGDVAIVRLWAGPFPSIADRTVFEVLHRVHKIRGRYPTYVRLRRRLHEIQGPITAEVKRIYPDAEDADLAEWKFTAGFEDDFAGLDLIAHGGLSTANLIPDRTGFGLGAVQLDGVDDYLESPDGAHFARQTFTVQFDVRFAVFGSTQPLLTGPCRDIASAEASSWWLRVGQTGNVQVGVCFDRNFGYTVFSSGAGAIVNDGRWYRLAIVRDAATGTIAVYRDGQLIISGTDARPIVYDAPAVGRGLILGRSDLVPPAYFAGALGWCRVSARAWTARAIATAHWIGMRNPVIHLREVLEHDLGAAIDDASFDETLQAVDVASGAAPNNGRLRCDLWVTQETTAQQVVDALAIFRDLTLRTTATGALAVAAAKPLEAIAAEFGHGEEWANLVVLERRIRASAPEAIRSLPVHFRPRRDVNGQLQGYHFVLHGDVLPIGREAEPILLPAVDSIETGGLLTEWLRKRVALQDELWEIVVGHEGRRLRPGMIDPVTGHTRDGVRLHLPAHGLETQDFRCVRVEHAGRRGVRLQLVKADNTVFLPSLPATLPEEPAEARGLVLEAGNLAAIQVNDGADTIPAGQPFTVHLLLEHVLRTPVAATHLNTWETLIGASTPHAAVDDPSEAPDEDASYLATSFHGRVLRFSAPLLTLDDQQAITAVRCVVRVRQATADPFAVTVGIRIGARTYDLATLPVVGSSYVTFPLEFVDPEKVEARVNPATGKPWTVDEVNSLVLEVRSGTAGTSGQLRLTQAYRYVRTRQDQPDAFRFARLWLRGPSTADPGPPSPVESPTWEGTQLLGITLTAPVTPTGVYWLTARIYDELGRAILLTKGILVV